MSETIVDFEFDRSRLALTYDVDRLQSETMAAIRHRPTYVYYDVIPLTRAGTANPEITDYSDPDWTTWVDTPLMQEYKYIQEVLDSLKCRKTNVRLMRLQPGGEVSEHTDPQLNLDFRNQVRLHVPILVSEQVEFRLNGTPVPLRPGELWYLRLSDPHSVHNRSDTERIQLSIDVVVNDWIQNQIVAGAMN